MPSFRNPAHYTHKPWHARARREGLEWSLGYYATKEEALAAEDLFAAEYPRKVQVRGKHQRGLKIEL